MPRLIRDYILKLTTTQIKSNAGFLEERGNRSTRRKPLASEKTTNKLNPHMTPDLGNEPGPHWWEASALTTAPYPQRDEQQDRLPHNLSLFTRERIESKIKDIMKKYKKAVLKYSCIMHTARLFHNHINESVIL